jgi:hypothetical protein
MSRLHKVLACSILLGLMVLDVSASFVYSSYQIPFDGMQLLYYSKTTPVLLQQAGLSRADWINLAFHDLTANSSKMDIKVSGNVTENGQALPINVNSTADFPTDRDTLLYLRNGGQQSIEIYVGAAGQAIQILPGFSLQLSRTWDLHDQTLVKTSLGNFLTYRYHTSLSYGGLVLDLYASYEKPTQVLVYGEVYATQGGTSTLVDKLELQRTNVQFQSIAQSQSSQCIIATAAYDSELASPMFRR